MKTFKVIDVVLQFVASAYMLCFFDGFGSGEGFIYWLMLIGIMHIISMLVHLFASTRYRRTGSRKAYELLVPFVLVSTWLKVDCILFLGPIMAAWYFITCLIETLRYYHHPRPTFF